MARANRHFMPGYIWHITHRCHKREFLFKFSRDRDRWLQLLFKARKRYHLSILNYIVTSNHNHLIVARLTVSGLNSAALIPYHFGIVQNDRLHLYNIDILAFIPMRPTILKSQSLLITYPPDVPPGIHLSNVLKLYAILYRLQAG